MHDFYPYTHSHHNPDLSQCHFSYELNYFKILLRYPHLILNEDEAQIIKA
jgi:hypothetical protein